MGIENYFDMLDKIKDMEYDKERDKYIGKDGSELQVKLSKDGKIIKYSFYESTTYNNAKHNSVHVKTDLSGNWNAVISDRDKKTKENKSGKGCYLTTACMMHYLDNFDDNCYELRVLRWFRDNYVSKEDIETYYKVAPIIVEGIEEEDKKDIIYNYIYDNVVDYCVKAIEEGDYEKAYTRYKSSIISFEETFARNVLNKKIVKMLKR